MRGSIAPCRQILFTFAVVCTGGCASDSTPGPTNPPRPPQQPPAQPPQQPPPSPPTPAQIQIVGGDDQIQIFGLRAADTLIVRVIGANGSGFSGSVVSWTVESGGGAVQGVDSATASDGRARALWTLGRSQEEQTVSARVGALPPVTFRARSVGPVDTHSHLGSGQSTEGEHAAAAPDASRAVQQLGMHRQIVMAPPLPRASYDADRLIAVFAPYRSTFAVGGGGGTLNPMIQEAVRAKSVSAELRRQFESTARSLADQGVTVFGEITALHLSAFDGHPFEEAPPDHELLRLLADIAAERDIPLDLHMEAVPADMSTPPGLARPPNPRTLRENIRAFERLLQHNRRTRIVWVHLGMDLTGRRTPELTRTLLERHPNLYMSIRHPSAPKQSASTRLTDADGQLRSDWLAVFRDFSDRFVLGSDHFFPAAGTPPDLPQTLETTVQFLALLPPDLALRFGYQNARRIYKLD